MPTYTAKINALSLRIRRLLDAELLLEEYGAALLADTDAARRSLEAGDALSAHWYIEQLTRLTEALMGADMLPLAEGQVILQITNGILNSSPDAGNAPC